jgi:hypothetical protein
MGAVMRTEPISLSSYYTMLMTYSALPAETQNINIFDITGYPHYENVCSNILKFFIDPNAGHGLGSLILKAILEFARIEVKDGISVKVRGSLRLKEEEK